MWQETVPVPGRIAVPASEPMNEWQIVGVILQVVDDRIWVFAASKAVWHCFTKTGTSLDKRPFSFAMQPVAPTDQTAGRTYR